MHIGIVSPVSVAQLAPFLNLNGFCPLGKDGATAPSLLIIELIKRGYKVSVFTLSSELAEGEECIVAGETLTLYFGPYQKRIRRSALTLFNKERSFLKKKILAIRPDVLNAHWQYEYAWAALDTGIRTIVTCRDSPVRVFLLFRNVYRLIRLCMAMIVLKKSTTLTVTSPYLKSELRKLGVKKRIEIIPNFEPDWLFSRPINVKNLSCPRIVMINNAFDNLKNVKVGIIGFQLFRKIYPNAELYLYGKGYERDGSAFNWAVKNSCNQNINYLGYLNFNSLMDELRNFTILIHPSKEETFGNILAESMALGVPVVGGIDSGAVPWVVGMEQTGGLLIDINRPSEICRAMHEIVSTQETYDNFARNARSNSLIKFSAKNVVDKYLLLYMNHERPLIEYYEE